MSEGMVDTIVNALKGNPMIIGLLVLNLMFIVLNFYADQESNKHIAFVLEKCIK